MAGLLPTTERLLYSQGGQEGGQFGYQGLPPEEALAQRALARKQQIANIMMMKGLEQAGQNNGQMVGRFYVPGSPWQNVAGLAQMGAAMYGSHRYDQQGEALQKQQGEMRAQSVQDYQRKMEEAQGGQTVEAAGPGAPVVDPNVPAPPMHGLAPASPPQMMEGARPTAVTPPNPAAARVAQAQLETSTDPYLRQYGMAEAQRQAQAAEHGMNREFLSGEKSLDRANQLAMTGSKIDQAMTLGLINAATGKQLKDELIAANKDMNAATNASREKVAGIGADAKVEAAGMKQGANRPMTATAQKELIQTEEEMQASHQAIQNLRSALDINEKALGFSGAGALSSAASLLPESVRPKSVDATVELDNLITGSALPQLKAIFGGMPTEGERKILLDVSGSTGKTPSQRKAIFERAIHAAEARIKFSGQKAEQIRKGTYFTGEGGLDTTVTPQTDRGLLPAAVGTATGEVAPFNDAEKERRYQEFKATHQ